MKEAVFSRAYSLLADAAMPEVFEHGGKLVGIITVMSFLAAAVLSGM